MNIATSRCDDRPRRAAYAHCRGVLTLICCVASSALADRVPMTYAPPPADNPLIGLVPYAGEGRDRFPHSMEFQYVALADLMTGPNTFDWSKLDKLLSDIASRGHQTIFRVYLEYPGEKSGVPQFLVDAGLTVHRYKADGQNMVTPDYADPRLRAALAAFITAMGERFDGDPRVGYITAGLLGYWGEWHTYPREDLMASKAVQGEVMDAYTKAFKQTPVLLRYPAGDGDPQYATNALRPFGYHDDSFAWGTLDTGKNRDDWFYLSLLKRAGATDKWKRQPIGGEIRPEAWGKVFDADHGGNTKIQDFDACVDQTHVSWLMDTGMFRKKQPDGRKERAIAAVRRMGYVFHVPGVTVTRDGDTLRLRIEIENRGVAPFYRDWPMDIGLIVDGKVVRTAKARSNLRGIAPGEKQVWEEAISIAGLEGFTPAIRVPNPLPGGSPVRFANTSQDVDAEGWLSLRAVESFKNPPTDKPAAR